MDNAEIQIVGNKARAHCCFPGAACDRERVKGKAKNPPRFFCGYVFRLPLP